MPGTYTKLMYHLVFSTKKRLPLITGEIRGELFRYLHGIVRGEGGSVLAVNGMNDHVHLLVRWKPTVALADLLRKLKANSSKWANEKLRYRKFGWQDGYSAFTVSQSQVQRVKNYIRNQEQHHRRSDFKRELIDLLERHEVEYDKRYLWD
jgi:REP element-mobilizing transposase RayT